MEEFKRFAQNMHKEPYRTIWLLIMGFLAGFVVTLLIM